MSGHPGFEFDAARKRAHFDCYVPGTAGEKRRRRTVFAATRADALALWRAFVDELAAEAPGMTREIQPQAPPRVLESDERVRAVARLGDFVTEHFPTIAAGLKRSTIRSHRSIIARRLLPIFGAVDMSSMTSIDVIDFKVALRNEGFSPSYINDCVRVLKMLLHQAVEREVIAEYPLRKKVPREKEPLLRLEMTDEERATFLATFADADGFAAHLARKRKKGKVRESDHFGAARIFGGSLRHDSAAARRYFARFRWLRPFFIVALETGLRKGDLLALRWASVDSREGWIRVTMEKTEFEATIAISVACAAALEECRARVVVSPHVFVDERGRDLSETRVRRAYALAKKLAGITRRCRFHDLRHTFASRLVSRGLNLRVVATALGHTTTEQTERYAKPSEAAMRAIKTALDADAIHALP